MSTTRTELHRIVDSLCEEYAEDVLFLVRNYLDEEETLTPEEEADIEAGLAEYRAGNFVTREELRAKYNLP